MLTFRRNTPKSWLLCAIFLVWLINFCESEDDRTLNLKIGFDIIPKKHGNPTLRIREFEGDRIGNLRKFGKRADRSQILARATSSTESDDNKDDDDKDEKIDHNSNMNDEAGESSDSEERSQRSTKGINPEEFEPERRPKRMHGRGKPSDSDTGER